MSPGMQVLLWTIVIGAFVFLITYVPRRYFEIRAENDKVKTENEELLVELAEIKEDREAERQRSQYLIEASEKLIDDLDMQRRFTSAKIAELEADADRRVRAARTAAVAQSKAVLNGATEEHLAPIKISWDLGDFRHSGDPIDYIVFRGYSDFKRKQRDDIDEIVLLDIKTGKSDLTKGQRRIRDAIVNSRIKFAVYNPTTDKLRTWPESNDE